MVGVCRLCATIRKEELFMSITDECDTICQSLHDFFNVKIKLDDVLPNTVCHECVNTLETVNLFYKKIKQSEESLLTFFKEKAEACAPGTKPEEEASANADEHFDNSLEEYAIEVNVSQEDNEEYVEFVDAELIDEDISEEDMDNSMLNIETLDTTQVSISSLPKVIDHWAAYTWLCYICTQPTASYADLVQHALHKHQVTENELLFRCADCHKTCARYFIFYNHVRMRHHSALMLACDICNLQCVNYEDLAQHRDLCCKSQQQIHLVICKKCGKAFRNTHSQNLHERLHHSNTAKIYDCQLCDKKFKRSFALRMHERVHREATDYSCNICGHAFRQKVNLEMHMYAHSEEKQYECAICKKCFKTAANLDKHGLTHTDIKEFQCQYCKKKFRTNDSRVSHERIHTGEKPYKCEYCEKSFRFRSTHLVKIMLI